MTTRCCWAALLVLSMTLMTALTACDAGGADEPTREPIDFSRFSQDSAAVEGRWELQRVGGYSWEEEGWTAGPPERPETLAFSEQSDPKRVTFEQYRDDTLREQGTYPTWDRLYEAEYDNFQFGVSNDTLAVSAAHRDGAERVYTRLREGPH